MLNGFCPSKKPGGGFIPHMAEGGIPPVSQMSPWWARKEEDSSLHSQGLLHSPVAGRTDLLNKNVPAGSYVVPADVVSGLGEGNTLAGSAVLDRMLSTGPHGISMPRVHGGHMGPPHPPAAYREPHADGGRTENVPVVLAGGEYLINPDAVKRLGKGDLKHGHDILDHFVLHIRKKTKDKLGKLKGPKR